MEDRFLWTDEKKAAVKLIAEGELTDSDVASRAGCTRQSIWLWRQVAEFNARIDEEREAIRQSLRHRAISLVEKRVNRLNRDWLKLQKVIEERAADPTMRDIPGGSTGTLVRTVKMIGNGDQSRMIEEYAVDVGTLREIREIEKQAAIQLEQWTEKKSIEGDPDKPVVVKMIRGISMDDL